MYTIYRVNADDLDSRFVDALKAMFKNKRIEIAVCEADQVSEDETLYLFTNEANRKRLMDAVANVERSEGLVYITPTELEKLA